MCNSREETVPAALDQGTRVPAAAFNSQSAKYVQDALLKPNTPVVITDGSKPAAVVISAEAYTSLRRAAGYTA